MVVVVVAAVIAADCIMAALRTGCGFFCLSFFISSPNISRRRLDVYHASTHGVALV